MPKPDIILNIAIILLLISLSTVFAKGGGGGGGGGRGGNERGGGGGYYGRPTNGTHGGGSTLWGLAPMALGAVVFAGIRICCGLRRRHIYTQIPENISQANSLVEPTQSATNNNMSASLNETLPVYSLDVRPSETVVNENYILPPTLPPPIYTNVLPDISSNHYLSSHENTTRELYEAGLQFSQQSPPSIVPPSIEELNYLSYYKNLAMNNWLIPPTLSEFVSTTVGKPSQMESKTENSASMILRFHTQDNDLSIQTQFPLPASLSDFFLQETICRDTQLCSVESITSISYFEVTILSKADPSVVFAIGLATRPYPHFRLPGWNIYSVGYHSDDGRKYIDDGYGGRSYSSSFGVGDVIGCGYERSSGSVFFTLNGNNLGIARQGMWHLVFPTLGADGDVDVQVNFGDSPFRYQRTISGYPSQYHYGRIDVPSGST